MSFEIVFCLVTFVRFSVIDASSWAELHVPAPPPSSQILNDRALLVVNSLVSGAVSSDKAPFSSCPTFSAENDVSFQLFTPKNPKIPQILKLEDVYTAKHSNFDHKIPTRMLIHGWLADDKIIQKFIDAYLVYGEHNVNLIAVEWTKGSNDINYYCARQRVNDVGKQVARFIDFMAKQLQLDVSTLNIIGQSIGAHISGIAGKKLPGKKVGKIVGLDPAGPYFKYEDVKNRLADTDASYVEVIYTCSGRLGHTEPLGQANFYVNGGRFQPGCGFDLLGICAHARSWYFYFESVVSPQFFAVECDSMTKFRNGTCSVINSVIQMGGEPGNSKSGGLNGIFYLKTNDQPMFGKGLEGVFDELEFASRSIPLESIPLNLPH